MQQPASVLLNRLLARARLRHMQVLVRLAELGSVRRTAEAIGMSQPAVTQILGDLEGMLETPLFHRHARGVRPTPACTDLLPIARQMLMGMAAGAEAVAARRSLDEGVVRLMASTASINGLLVHAFPALNDRYPALQIQLKMGEVDDLLLAIAHGEVDAGCCRKPAVVPEGWAFHEMLSDHFVVACSPEHPMAGRRQLEWGDLAGETWLPAPAGSAARTLFDGISARFDPPLQTCQIITRVPAMTWWLLRHRPLLTLVPFGVVRHLVDAGQLAVLKMKEVIPWDPLGMLLPLQDLGAATSRVAEFLQQFAAKQHKAARKSSHAPRR